MSLHPSVCLSICLRLAARKWNCLLKKKMNLFFPYLFCTTLRWCNIEERLPVVFKLLMKLMTTSFRKVWAECWIKWLMKTTPSSCRPADFPLNLWPMLLITWANVCHTHMFVVETAPKSFGKRKLLKSPDLWKRHPQALRHTETLELREPLWNRRHCEFHF